MPWVGPTILACTESLGYRVEATKGAVPPTDPTIRGAATTECHGLGTRYSCQTALLTPNSPLRAVLGAAQPKQFEFWRAMRTSFQNQRETSLELTIDARRCK